MITDPTLIFAVVLAIILTVPLVSRKLRIPHLVGMIVAGVIVGEHGLGLLARDSSFELFGKVGLYYIMFLASLELDMEGLKKNRRRGIVFGILTFLIPFAVGFPVGLWLLRLSVPASLLLACILASHTLVSYPIAGRYGLGRTDCVTIAVCGTMIALLLALVILAFIPAGVEGRLAPSFLLWMGAKTTLYALIIFLVYPKLTRWFFKRFGDNITQFIFVMTLMILSAAMADAAGLEGLLGAFLAGLVLNRYIPHVSPLMNRIEFVGNALFIPYFLISVGMLINISALWQSPAGIVVIGVMLITAVATKWGAAWLTQKMLKLKDYEREMLFGLSSAHAAGALAMVMVGTRLVQANGMPVMDDNVLNGVVAMILGSCIVSSVATERAAFRTAKAAAEQPTPQGQMTEKLMVAINNPDNVEELMSTAILMRGPKATGSIVALHVSIDGIDSERRQEKGRENLRRAAAIGASADVPVITQNRLGTNPAGSILHAFKESDATELILGLHHRHGFADSFLGNTLSSIIGGTHRQVVIMKHLMPINVIHRIVVAVPAEAESEVGFYRWLERICRMGEQLGCRADFHGHPQTLRLVSDYIRTRHPNMRFQLIDMPDWNDLLTTTENLSFDHLFVLVSARRGSLSWQPSFDNLPNQLMKYFMGNSLMIIYPEQRSDVLSTTFTNPIP
jgi:Kef-type K+ transport system membrane component KefB